MSPVDRAVLDALGDWQTENDLINAVARGNAPTWRDVRAALRRLIRLGYVEAHTNGLMYRALPAADEAPR